MNTTLLVACLSVTCTPATMDVEEMKAKIKAHKGHLTREINSLDNATVFCARNPSADARGEVEELLKRVKSQTNIIREFYDGLCDVDAANFDAYSKKLTKVQDRYEAVSQEALEAMDKVNLTVCNINQR